MPSASNNSSLKSDPEVEYFGAHETILAKKNDPAVEIRGAPEALHL